MLVGLLLLALGGDAAIKKKKRGMSCARAAAWGAAA